MFTFSGILKTLRVQGLWPFCSKFYCQNLALCLIPSSCLVNIHWLDFSAFHLNPAFPVLFIHIVVYCRFSTIYTFMLVCLMLAVFSCIILYWRAESPCTHRISFVQCFCVWTCSTPVPSTDYRGKWGVKIEKTAVLLETVGMTSNSLCCPCVGQGARGRVWGRTVTAQHVSGACEKWLCSKLW